MELINIENYIEKRFKTAIALGNFDGVHLGHQRLITDMINKAKSQEIKSSVLLFENHTKAFLDGTGPALISSPEQKNHLIRELGVEIIYSMQFNEDVMKLTPEEFVIEILLKKLNAKVIVVGTDYRFGHKASGDAKLLKELGEIYAFEVEIVQPVYIDDEIVSSTKIRKYLSEGRIEKALSLIGRDYSINGKVVSGKKIGNKLGFPTANIEPNVNYVVPKNGVYRTVTIVDNKKYLSATSVGYNPTFKESAIKIESHIIDFSDDIYGKTIELVFKKYLREEIKFKSIELLQKQILNDILHVKNI